MDIEVNESPSNKKMRTMEPLNMDTVTASEESESKSVSVYI